MLGSTEIGLMSKFPDAEREALAVVDRYLVAINDRDTKAIRDAFNFLIGPHPVVQFEC